MSRREITTFVALLSLGVANFCQRMTIVSQQKLLMAHQGLLVQQHDLLMSHNEQLKEIMDKERTRLLEELASEDNTL